MAHSLFNEAKQPSFISKSNFPNTAEDENMFFFCFIFSLKRASNDASAFGPGKRLTKRQKDKKRRKEKKRQKRRNEKNDT